MTAPELKPCPFCGCADIAPSVLTGGVFCEECGADGPWSPAFHGDWNTRAAPLLSAALELPEVRALVEAVRPYVSPVQNADYGRQLRQYDALVAALAAIEKGTTP